MRDKLINILDWIYIICAFLLMIIGKYEMGMLVLLVSNIMNIRYKIDEIDNKLNNM